MAVRVMFMVHVLQVFCRPDSVFSEVWGQREGYHRFWVFPADVFRAGASGPGFLNRAGRGTISPSA